MKDNDSAPKTPQQHQQYFRQLMGASRKICLQYQWPVDKEEIATRLAPFQAVREKCKQTSDQIKELEKQKRSPEEVDVAKKEHEIALEARQNVEDEILEFLESSVLSKLKLDQQPKEVIHALMKCTILQKANPGKLADFCQESEYNTKIVYELLDSSPSIMKEMLLNGGASGGNYGRSYSIFKHLVSTIDPNDKLYGPCHRRLAMAVALEHGEPIPEFDTPDIVVNPFLRFDNLVQAHKNGELDPAFSYFSTWEYRHIVNCNATEGQIKWGRDHLKRYRPDQVVMPDMAWRYAAAVRSDVGYRQPSETTRPQTYPQLVSGGGKCGARAWYGRFICKAFGIPTWGVRQPGHAAMSRWTPSSDGWVTILGLGWDKSNWERRTGRSFRADAHSRAFLYNTEEETFAKITLLECMAEANSEKPMKSEEHVYDPAFLWGSLVNAQRVLLSRKATEESFHRGPPKGTESDAKFKSQIDDFRARKDPPLRDNKIEVQNDGTIVIPACAFAQKQNCQPMKSFEGGGQLFVKNDSFVEYKMPGTFIRHDLHSVLKCMLTGISLFSTRRSCW